MSSRVQLTPEQARSFPRGVSVANAIAVMNALDCACIPYEDTFTYGRWRGLGMQVRRGEHGIRIGTVRTVPVGDTEQTRTVPGSAVVFCRCQVDPA